MKIVDYLKKHINKETTIMIKDSPDLIGKIIEIDYKMNITVLTNNKKIKILGNKLKGFYL